MEDRFRARTVAAQAAPAPFWTRIPAIATYPLRGSALYALIALTLCGALLVLPGILKLVIAGVLGMATYTYAFDILRHTADGQTDAPRLGYNSFDSAVLRLILLAIALGIVIGAGAVIAGPFGLTIAYLGTMLLLPGMLISLAIDGSLRRALNPAVSIDMALRIGWPYLAAYGLLYVIQGSGTAAVFFATRYLPRSCAKPRSWRPRSGRYSPAFTCWGIWCTSTTRSSATCPAAGPRTNAATRISACSTKRNSMCATGIPTKPFRPCVARCARAR